MTGEEFLQREDNRTKPPNPIAVPHVPPGRMTVQRAGESVVSVLNRVTAPLSAADRRKLFVDLVDLLRAAVAEVDEATRRAAPPVLAETPAAEPVAFGKGSRSSDTLDQAA